MNELRLPRLVSDGMVLQQGKEVHIWGQAEAGSKITVDFCGAYETITDDTGSWELYLPSMRSGGPYELKVNDDRGNEIVLSDILIGDVFYCSGQSNIDVPMSRVKDNFPEEIKNCRNDNIRIFKVDEHGEFHGPIAELLSGAWKSACQENIMGFSATAYFFATSLYEITGIPVGVITASLGGSCIEAWMSREMLSGYDDRLQITDKYADDAFLKSQLEKNMSQMTEWHRKLDAKDIGIKYNWSQGDSSGEGWRKAVIPFWFSDTELSGFIGSVWFRRSFFADSETAGQAAMLWLGTIVDSDTVYVNGVEVGHTDYQYPPRKYPVPEGLLREGENEIVIRVKCDTGHGRFTQGKRYAIFNENFEIKLEGEWEYRIGAECEKAPETDFVNWKPTVLYSGMTAPCHNYTICGILWYQGEANIHEPDTYGDLLKRMIEGYRSCWRDTELPFIYVQLPNLDIDLVEVGDGVPQLREQQRKALSFVPHTGMAVTLDAGEDNDWHPMDKKTVGYRLSLIAASLVCGKDIEYHGPEVSEIKLQNGQIRIICKYAEGLYATSKDKGNEIKDFNIVDYCGRTHWTTAEIKENEIILNTDLTNTEVSEIRYCFSNTNKGALIYNKYGLPMAPFSEKV